MDKIKPYFPIAFSPKADSKALIVNLVVHLVAWLILVIISSILSIIELPALDIIIGLVMDVVKIYLGASAIISVLDYLKVFKE